MARAPAALLHNWRLKLSALGLAVFFWALVQTDPRESEIFSAVPLEVLVADTSWTLAGAPGPGVVELRLGGPAREIIQLARDGATVRVPIDAVGSNDTVVTLRREWVDLGESSGLTVESLTPANIRLSFERALTKTVPVVLVVEGEMPANRSLASPIAVDPSEVRVRGPRNLVAAIDSLRVPAFDLATAQQTDLHRVDLDTTGLPGVAFDPPTVTLGVRVEDRMERIFMDIDVEVPAPGAEADLSFEPSAVTLRIAGAQTLVESVDPTFLRVWIDPDRLQNFVEGEARTVPLRVEGVPDLVSAQPDIDVITVRRVADGGGGGVEE